ncbi:hypothetical protein KZZ52_31855 [Dactylosporangium sp. AC04546]|uniref:hypothetical protein n=1 Tax=Dactylosporangium sp. AC04546 TaxID=2862460 RepID=UPI001EDCF7A0|nr:hypothetical protein [Dactylosporangium sp. AC04546]WVK78587.1 hypothetical protein KZZ52_31855 [Dactylosporangium sp. AC04546]
MREFTDPDVDVRVDLAALVEEVSRCLADLGRGAAVQAPKQLLPLDAGGFFLSLAGVVPRLGLGVAKWASYVPGTAGEPGRSTSTIIGSDATTGAPLATVTGMRATQVRTAAAAVAVARAVRADRPPRRIALVGFGPTNRAVLDAVLAVAGTVTEVRVVVRTEHSAATARRVAGARGLDVLSVGTDPAAVAGVDLAFSATGATGPVATLEDLAPDGVAVCLDGAGTWRRGPSTPVLDDHMAHGHVPAVPRLLAGVEPVPDGRVLLDLAGSAVTDVALVAQLLRRVGR